MGNELTIEQWLTLVTFLLAAVVISILTIGTSGLRKKIKVLETNNKDFLMVKPPMEYEMCKDILDTCISNVINDLQLRYTVNNVKYIKNMDKETKESTLEVMKLVSDNVIEQMQCYVTKTYIIQYVSRNIRGFLMAYLKENNK